MVADPRIALQLAFQHLDAFSVPNVGTFRRVRFSAVIDHQSGKIQPPGERFVLEKGETLVPKLEDFFFRYFDVSIHAAQDLVLRVSAFVSLEIKKKGQLTLPGIGDLKPGNGQELELISASGQMGGVGSQAFFGLPAVNMTLGQSAAVKAAEKEAAAKRLAALKGAPVEAAPKPIRDSKKKKSNFWRNAAVILLLLIMMGSAAGIVWQDKFQGWMEQMGWISSNVSPTDTLLPPPTSSVVKPVPIDTVDKGSQDLEPEHIVANQPADEPKAQPDLKKVEPAVPALADWNGMGEHAKDGVYYLVVGARKDANGAREIAKQISGSGINARVLVPRTEGPHYKVFVYQNASKSSVIKKMVEWKNKFPEKSWIFWIGM